MSRTWSPTDEERLARLALSELGEPGGLRMANLLSGLTATELHSQLMDPHPTELSRDVAARLAALDPQRDLEQASRRGIRWVVPGDPEWPANLDDLESCVLSEMGGTPLGLWVRGPLRLDQLPRCVAIVGSRSSTTYGDATARQIATAVAQAGLGVVSGAAFGIDQAAHRGAIAGRGATVAVLACGVDRAYPAAHKPLLDHLADHGAVVSELAPGRAPTRLRFLARNRVIAALAGGTVVVEAAVRSGALNTASWSSLLNRPLMAVPGPVTSAASEGAHQLIRSGGAILVTSAAEVLEVIGRPGEFLAPEPRGSHRARDLLTRRQQQVLEAVPKDSPAPVTSIARTAGLGTVEVATTLASLEARALVAGGPRGWQLTRAAAG